MIPVLIVPVVSRHDLAEQMIASVDADIERIVVIDNSCSGATVKGATHHIRPILGLGYPGGINAGILQTPECPWWLWASNDMTWGPGDLSNITALIEAARGPRMVTGTDRRLRNVYGAMNREAVEAVGLFDEGFYPIYFDDDDMEWRCRQGGVEWIGYDGTIKHAQSITIHDDPKAAAANGVTFGMNRDRYIAKWGGPPGSEAYSRPWNRPVPLSYAPVDIEGRARKVWK